MPWLESVLARRELDRRGYGRGRESEDGGYGGGGEIHYDGIGDVGVKTGLSVYGELCRLLFFNDCKGIDGCCLGEL